MLVMCPVDVVRFNVHVLQYRAWRDISRVVLSEAARRHQGGCLVGRQVEQPEAIVQSLLRCIYQFLFAVCFCVFLRLSLKGH